MQLEAARMHTMGVRSMVHVSKLVQDELKELKEDLHSSLVG